MILAIDAGNTRIKWALQAPDGARHAGALPTKEALRLGDRIAIMRNGRFVQVGTPAEVVLEPADEYVENFVRDVPRSHVVPVEAVMAPPSDGPFAGEVPAGTKVRDVVAMVAHNDLPVRVVRDGATIGTIDRVGVLSVIAGEDR